MEYTVKQVEREFQPLKPHDLVQFTQKDKRTDFMFLTTAGHGYLAIPKSNQFASLAKQVLEKSGYGYESQNFYFLEEDCEYSEFLTLFLDKIKSDLTKAESYRVM